MASQEGPPSSHLEKTLNALLLLQLRGMPQRESVDYLDRSGFGQNEIAALLNSTGKAISVRLAEIRKTRKKRKGSA